MFVVVDEGVVVVVAGTGEGAVAPLVKSRRQGDAKNMTKFTH